MSYKITQVKAGEIWLNINTGETIRWHKALENADAINPTALAINGKQPAFGDSLGHFITEDWELQPNIIRIVEGKIV